MDTLFGHPGHILLMLIASTLPHMSLQMGGGSSRQYEFTDVRLVNGSFGAPNSGRVEVQLDSSWLDVCDRDWKDDDGVAACRQLGYPGFSQTKTGSYFGQGTNNGSANRFDCKGGDTLLSDCSLREEPSFSMNCRNNEGAGLICTPPGYIGCYRDDTNNRVFGSSSLTSDNMTIIMCLDHCRVADMQLAGLQAGDECYCGGPDIMLGASRNDKDCSDMCSGNRNETCGRGRMPHLSVYNVTLGYCADPGSPPDGSRSSTDESFHFGSVVTFDCDEGFELMGAPSIQCVLGDSPEEVQWTDMLPSCEQPTEEPMGSVHTTADVDETTEMTTRERETTAATETTPSDVPGRTPNTAKRTQTPEVTMTKPQVTNGEENGSSSPSTTTMRGTQSPLHGSSGGSKVGKYVGLAVGCILFIVCACLIVVCLLRRAQRKRDQNGNRSIIPLSSGVEQHSAVYGNSETRDGIAMSQRGQSKSGYTAPNPSPAHSLDVYKGKEGVLVEAVATGKEAPNPRNQQAVGNPLYSGEVPDSSPKRSAKRPETDDTTSDSADYFSVEEKGNSMGSTHYSTGVTGHETPPQRRQTPLQMPDLSTPEDIDIDDHYYSSANPPSNTGARVPQNKEDCEYAYADPSERVTGAQHQEGVDKSPNADYFAIEEPGNTMGIPLYNIGENGPSKENQPSAPPKEETGKRDQRGADSDGDEYAYADPAGLGEGWVENTVYVSGP